MPAAAAVGPAAEELVAKPEVVAVEEQPRVQLVVALVLHKVETVVMV